MPTEQNNNVLLNLFCEHLCEGHWRENIEVEFMGMTLHLCEQCQIPISLLKSLNHLTKTSGSNKEKT